MASIAKHLHGRGEDPREPFGASEDLGNTSTDVEKTSTRTTFPLRVRKHLHGRGEDTVDISVSSYDGETPPRTWRRREWYPTTHVQLRNTSTDVEKTTCWLWHPAVGWKHLHGRGEDSKPSPFLLVHPEKHLHGRGEDQGGNSKLPFRLETPPRTWRRPRMPSHRETDGRNTSTDVEKTICFRKPSDMTGETPPRTWRRLIASDCPQPVQGNTSTDVEKTTNAVLMVHSFGETPPRTWRRPPLLRLGTRWRGNTSTDVEKT